MSKPLLFIASFLGGLATAHAATKPISVYVLAGQSNAVGGASMLELPDDLRDPQASLYQWKVALPNGTKESKNWEPLQPAVPGTFPMSYSVELSFAQAMELRTGNP